MSDDGDYWRDVKNASREYRAKHGIDCPGCQKVQPKRIPTRLIPGKRCKVCGYRDTRSKPKPEA